MLGGQAVTNIGRLLPTGVADPTFNPETSGQLFGTVFSLAVAADGKILVGGWFNALGGQPRNYIGRLTGGGAALQSLTINAYGTTATWGRSGAGPEIEQVTFEQSTDGTNYIL